MAKGVTDETDAESAVAGPALDPGAGWRVSPYQVRALVDAAPVAVVAVDGEGRISLVNAQAEELFGYGRYELTGSPVDILLPEQFREVHAGHRAGFFAQPFVRPMGLGRGMVAQRKDGSEFAVDSGLSFIEVGDETLAVAFVADVTERRQAEEALRESEERFRDVLGASRDLTYKINLEDGGLDYVSPSVLRLTGFTPQEFGALGLDGIAERFHPETRGRVEAVLRDMPGPTIEADQVPEVEYRWQRKDGEYHWFSDHRTVIRDERGRAAALVGNARDITGRKRGEEALRESEERYRSLAEGMPAAVGMLQGEHFVYVNSAAASLTGYTRDELLAMGLRDVMHPDDVGLLEEQALARVRGENVPSRYEARLITKDGSELWIDIKGRLSDFHGKPSVLAMVLNITERKRAEKALRESEERFRTSVGTMLDCFGIYSSVRDQSGRIVDFRVEYVNEAACASNRMTSEEQVGKGLLELLPAHRESGLFEEYCQVVDTGQPLSKASLVYEDTYAGSRLSRAFDISVTKLHDGIAAAWRDITERKRAEETLRRQQEEQQIILDSVPALIFYKDRGNRFVHVNRALVESSGMPREALEGGSAFELFPEHAEKYWRDDKEVMESGQAKRNIIEPMETAGGTRWVRTDKIPYRDASGNIVGIVGFSADITEQKQAEEELRESEALNRALLEAVPDMMFRLDRDGNYLGFIPAEGQDPPVTAGEVVGLNVRDVMPTDVAERLLRRISAALDGRGAQTLEYERTMKGTRRHEEGRIVRSGPEEALAIVRDLTEQRQTEEAQRKAREELERRVECQMLRSNPYHLTFRELTVLHLVADGKADKEVAVELGIRTATAQKHISNILHKMNAASRTEAGVRAVREGLLG